MYALCTFLFVLGTVLTQIAFATPSKSKYLRFSNQKAATFTKATNYATLQSGGSDVISSKRFTLCGSIYIGFFRGYQAFYTVRKNDQRTLWFSVGLYNQDLSEETYTPSIFLSYIRKEKYNPATTPMYVTLRLPPLDSEMGWTGELWSKTNLLN